MASTRIASLTVWHGRGAPMRDRAWPMGMPTKQQALPVQVEALWMERALFR